MPDEMSAKRVSRDVLVELIAIINCATMRAARLAALERDPKAELVRKHRAISTLFHALFDRKPSEDELQRMGAYKALPLMLFE